MAIEAPLSRYKRNNFKVYIVVCLALGGWFAYDGYISKSFISEHTDEKGKPDGVLVVNQKAPPVLAVLAGVIGAYYYLVKDRKVVAEDTELVIAGKKRIPYVAIDAIDRTHFEEKGTFTIIYKDPGGAVARHRLTDRQFDNLGPILDHLVAQIT